ncbi:MAG: FHA domain-containing protein [Candidatus Eremiobacteraeota bacterium]|nr:FHA domain-containing protein [Candidatus Eremiobacteraeota bacterium]
MSFLARIEEACAGFIEKAFARTFRSALEPAQIARKLIAKMEAQAVHSPAGVQAPDRYAVHVSADDYHRLGPHRELLEHEWSALLTDMAQRVHIQLSASPVVRLVQDLAVVAGSVQIEALLFVVPEEEATRPNFAAPVLQIRVTKGVPLNARVELAGPVTIGRDKDSDLALSDPGISRHHARLQARGGAWMLHDLESTNGTFVNGTRVDHARIGKGDVVTLGSTRLCVEETVR